MADLLLAVKLVLENGQYKAEIVNSEKLTKNLGTTGKQSFNELASAAASAPGPVGNVARSMQGLVSGATLARVAITGVVAAIGAFVIGVAKGTVVAGEHERQLRRLEAQVRATGGAAGKSAQQLDEQSAALARSTLFSDDEIRSAQGRLLTFTSISGAMFDRALRGATDLASVMEGGLSGAVVALGKALEDPEEGLTALGRAGIKFSERQKEVIKGLADAGDKGAALAKVLEVIEGKLGGVAAAEAQGYSGAIHNLAESWEDLLEAIGNTSAFERTTLAIGELVEAARRLVSPTEGERVTDLFKRQAQLTKSITEQETGGELSIFGGGEKLEKKRAELAAVEAELDQIRQSRAATNAQDREREAGAEKLRIAREIEDRKRAEAEKAKARAKANVAIQKDEDAHREQLLADDTEALQKSIEARQIVLKTTVETEQALLDRARDRQQITDAQYFDARRDLAEAAYAEEIDLRERLLLLADAKERSVVEAQIEDLKARRLRAIDEIADAERKAQDERIQRLQARASTSITRASQAASVVDARVSTGALTPSQGRSQLAESTQNARVELRALRGELIELLDKTPNDPALINVLGQVQDALAQTRTEAEILGDQVVGVFTGGAVDAISDFASGTKSLGDAWSDAASSIVRSITRIVTELLVMAAAQQLVGLAGYSIKGGQLIKLEAAGGGYISGPGTSTSDSIPADLSDGEYVVKAASVSRFGRGFFDALNAGFAPSVVTRGYAAGGYVGAASGGGMGVQVQVINAGEPAKVSRTERGQGSDGSDLYKIFIEPAIARDIARNGPITQQLSSALGLSRTTAVR